MSPEESTFLMCENFPITVDSDVANEPVEKKVSQFTWKCWAQWY